MCNKLWFDVDILFYNGQWMHCKLENSNLVLLQMMVRNRQNIKEHQKFFFDKEGVLIDTRCIMSTKEKMIDDDCT